MFLFYVLSFFNKEDIIQVSVGIEEFEFDDELSWLITNRFSARYQIHES